MKKLTLTIVALLAFSAFVSSVSAAPGDLIWSKTYNPSADRDQATGVAVDGTGVYIVGFDSSLGATNTQWRVQKRSLTTGGLIWSKTSNPSTGGDQAMDVAVDSTGVYIVGFDSSPSPYGGSQWRVQKRSLTTGGLIWSKISNPSTGSDDATGVAVDGTGVYIVGFDSSLGATNTQWRVQKRSLTTGGLIWSKTSNPTTYYDMAYDVAVDATGVYIVGYQYAGAGDVTQWRIEKRSLTTGGLIWSKTSNPTLSEDEARGVAVDSTGVYIVGCSHTRIGHPSNWEWRIEKRSLTTGSLIWSKTSDPTLIDDIAWGVAVDGTGVYIVGHQYVSAGDNKQWRIEKRGLATGNLIWSKKSNPSTSRDVANDVAVDSTGVYIVGIDSIPGWPNFEWRIEKRVR